MFQSARILIVFFSRVVRTQTDRYIFHNLHPKDLFFLFYDGTSLSMSLLSFTSGQ